MADEGKKKKFVVEEVVGDEAVHSEDLEKETKEEETVETPVTVEEAITKEESKEEVTEEKEENEESPVNDLSETSDTSATESASSETSTPQVPEQKTNIKLVIVLTAFIALILGGVAGGVLVFISGQDSLVVEPSPTPVVSVAPTATPAPEVDKQSVTVAIQNGSGIAGEGGRMSQLLTTAGFKVGTVGNASSFDHEETVIQAKDTVNAAFLELLGKTLSEKYKVGENEKLPTTSTSDITIIVGSEKAE